MATWHQSLLEVPLRQKLAAGGVAFAAAVTIYVATPAYLHDIIFWLLIFGAAGFCGGLAASSTAAACYATAPAVAPMVALVILCFVSIVGPYDRSLGFFFGLMFLLAGTSCFVVVFPWCLACALMGFKLRQAVLRREAPFAHSSDQAKPSVQDLMRVATVLVPLGFALLIGRVEIVRHTDLDAMVDRLSASRMDVLARGSSAVPALVRGLEKRAPISEDSLGLLGVIRPLDPSILPAITAHLATEQNPLNRGSYLDIIAGIRRSSAAVAELRSVAREDASEAIRAKAVHLLSGLRVPPADSEAFYRSLVEREREAGPRLEAYAALKDPTGRDLALDVLQRNDAQNRDAAIRLLGILGDPRDTDRLKALAHDNNTMQAAVAALRHEVLMRLPEDQRLDYLLGALDGYDSEYGGCVNRWAADELEHRFDWKTRAALEIRALRPTHDSYQPDAKSMLRALALNE